jgi:undecaprenyl-diphosphatase
MDIVAAAILGVVQGLTEFLPISSSAHLILVPWLFGWEPNGLLFDVSLHVGTAIAILAFFWKDWFVLARETVLGLFEMRPFANAERRLAWFLVIGTIPAMVVGLAFEKTVEDRLRSPLVTVVTLVLFGLVLYFAERSSAQSRTLRDLTLADTILIGLCQALALIPGVSRSGITISAAMLKSMDRPSAARFSFLLATPIIVGAGLLEGVHFLKVVRHPAAGTAAMDISGSSFAVLAVGVAAAAVTGFLCIRYFLRYIQSNSFVPFVVYRIALAAVVLLMYMRAR